MFGFHHTHRSSANQWHWSIYLAEFKSIVISIHIFWKLLQEIFSGCTYFLSPEICLYNEKVKVRPGKENTSYYWRPKVNDKFLPVWNNILGKAQHTVEMEQNLENHEFGLKDVNILKKNAEKWGEVIYLKLRIPCVIYLLSKYVAISTHVWFSHMYVVKSIYYTGTSCVALTTQVCFIAHECGKNQTCVGKPTHAGVGFFPHTCGKTHTWAYFPLG